MASTEKDKDETYAETKVVAPSDVSDSQSNNNDQAAYNNNDEKQLISPYPEPDKNAKGEYIIRTGADAAYYLMSLRDDGDDSLTVRSFVIGTLFGAARCVMSVYSEVSNQCVGDTDRSSSGKASRSADLL
jgi:hypothetical protein